MVNTPAQSVLPATVLRKWWRRNPRVCEPLEVRPFLHPKFESTVTFVRPVVHVRSSRGPSRSALGSPRKHSFRFCECLPPARRGDGEHSLSLQSLGAVSVCTHPSFGMEGTEEPGNQSAWLQAPAPPHSTPILFLLSYLVRQGSLCSRGCLCS